MRALVIRPVLVPPLLVLFLFLSGSTACGGGKKAPGPRGADPRLVIAVDRRIELVSIVCRLAGYPEYAKDIGTAYARDVDAHFAPFRDHPAVRAAVELKRVHGISFNAPIGLAVYLDDALIPKRALTPPLPGLDPRWNAVDPEPFVGALQDFAEATGFEAFFAEHAGYHRDVEGRVRAALDGHRIVDWFDAHFGPRPRASYRVIPGLLTGTMAFSASATDDDGTEEIVQVLDLRAPDAAGLPVLPPDAVFLLVHEIAHSYVNPILDARAAIVLPAAEPVFARHVDVMSRQHYKTAAIMANESVVRALVVLYARDRGPEGADTAQLFDEHRRGFVWTKDLVTALATLRTYSAGPFPPDDVATAVREVFTAAAR